MRKKRRILLIEPPFYRLYKHTYSLSRYSLGLGYLAAEILKMPDWTVSVYNADFAPRPEQMKVSYLTGEGFENYRKNLADISAPIWKEIAAVIADYQPGVVGISAKSQNFTSSCIVAQLVKEWNKNTIVIVGGPHPSMVGHRVPENPYIDIAVKGEGESTMVELLNVIDSGGDLSTVNGIVFKSGGQIIENPPRPLNRSLDRLGFPNDTAAQVLRDYSQYNKNAFRFVFPARGCPYNCFFCGSRNIWTRTVRYRSVANVIREIENLRQMGITSIQFEDDTFGVNRRYTFSLCDELNRHFPGLEWSCKLHAGLVDEELAAKLKETGCTLAMLGIESGSNEMLEKIRKGITIQQAFAAADIIKSHGIRLHAFFMVGFPEETEETLKETAAAMEKINSDFLVYSIFTPYPGTEAFIFCEKHRLIGEDYDVSLYNHQSPANCFCLYIKPERFRVLVGEIETLVDRKNTLCEIRQLEKLEDKNDYTVYRIASLYESLGEYEKSVSRFNGVLECSSNSEVKGGAYFHMGEIYFKTGRKKQSRRFFEMCLEMIPGHSKANRYLHQLQA